MIVATVISTRDRCRLVGTSFANLTNTLVLMGMSRRCRLYSTTLEAPTFLILSLKASSKISIFVE